jgi:hypothetical protein
VDRPPPLIASRKRYRYRYRYHYSPTPIHGAGPWCIWILRLAPLERARFREGPNARSSMSARWLPPQPLPPNRPSAPPPCPPARAAVASLPRRGLPRAAPGRSIAKSPGGYLKIAAASGSPGPAARERSAGLEAKGPSTVDWRRAVAGVVAVALTAGD